MSHALTFDTLKAVETLEAAGFDRGQAKAISSTFQAASDALDVATKADIDMLKHDIDMLKRDIQDVRKEMNTRFEKLSLQLTVRLGVMMALAVGVLATIMKL